MITPVSLLGESLHYLEDCLHVKGLFRKSPAVSRLRELEVMLIANTVNPSVNILY